MNSLNGRIEKLRFEGTHIRYEVRLENEDRIEVSRPTLVSEWFNVNDEVTVSFPSEKSYVFTYPSKGLREELAVE